MNILFYVLAGAALIVAAVAAFFIGIAYRKKTAEEAIGSAEQQAKKLVNDAVKSAETRKREMLLEAKDEIHKLRTESDREIKEQRGDLQRLERRIQQKEEVLDKKVENIEKKEENLKARLEDADKKLEEIENVKKSQIQMLERISNYTTEQAKEYLLQCLDGDLDHEKAIAILNYQTEIQNECDAKAQECISLAIQRCAADHVTETTVSVIPLPSDEMKGRIIGREGRNIRAIEQMTGVDIIIDDTPEAITISTFDPVRREIARQCIEKLIGDGRIHPTRIEDMVEKAKKEVEAKIKEEGENAVLSTGLHGIHPEIIKILGRLKYRSSYGQNVLKHSLEVSYLAGMMAAEIGADVTLAKRAGLLHDLGKALNHEIEGSHVQIGVDIAKKYKENNEVIHAIQAHHGDVEAKTITACLVQAADAISAARPGARRENLENYIKRLEKLEEIANSFEGIDKCFALSAGREIRIMVKPEQVSDDKMILIARDIVKKIESELEYPGQIKVNLIRENRAVDFAK